MYIYIGPLQKNGKKKKLHQYRLKCSLQEGRMVTP